MDTRRSTQPLHGRWHSLLEQYTPDGALGRLLLGVPTGTFGLWLLALLTFEIPRWGLAVGTLFWAPILFGAGMSAVLLAVVTLWPLYLSLIGNLESADAYSVGGDGASLEPTGSENVTTSAAGTARSSSVDGEESEDDPFADLKAKYANGDLSEEEFERRIDERLQGNGERSGSANSSRGRSSEGESTRERTPERN